MIIASKKHDNKIAFEMFKEDVLIPIFSVLTNWVEFAFLKFIVFAGGIISYLSLELFTTPEAWWKTLTYLVLIDWSSGIIVSVAAGQFQWRYLTVKAYKATGYIMVCSSAALVANGMPEVFFYAQFVVYAAFLAKEFYSILRQWRVWALFSAVFKIILQGKSYLGKFNDLTEALEHEQERFEKNRFEFRKSEQQKEHTDHEN